MNTPSEKEDKDISTSSVYNLRSRLSSFRFAASGSPVRKASSKDSPRSPTKPAKYESRTSSPSRSSKASSPGQPKASIQERGENSSTTAALGNSSVVAVSILRTRPRKRTKSESDPAHAPLKLEDSSGESPTKKVKREVARTKRGFAPPETYAHLLPLQDYLADELDVLFCGINPGERSATVGHHFANPTNHFWRCLAGSGLTDRLLSPSEDFTLPEQYNLGLTNLVDRPSKQEAELAPSEFTAGVPVLLHKIARLRPRIVCFVGKGIWDAFERALPVGKPPAQADDGPGTSTNSSPILSPRKGKGRRGQKEPFKWDLQPYKVVHPKAERDTNVQETLFLVSPSTSGRVTSHQLPQKTALFTLLKQRVEESKQQTIDTASMTVIPLSSS